MPIKDVFNSFRSVLNHKKINANLQEKTWEELKIDMEEASAYHIAMRQMSERNEMLKVQLREKNEISAKARPAFTDLQAEVDGIIDAVAGVPEYQAIFTELRKNMFGSRVSTLVEANRNGELDSLKSSDPIFRDRINDLSTAYESMSSEEQEQFSTLNDKEVAAIVNTPSDDYVNGNLSVEKPNSIPQPITDNDSAKLGEEVKKIREEMKGMPEYNNLEESLGGKGLDEQVKILKSKIVKGELNGLDEGVTGEELSGLMSDLENISVQNTNEVRWAEKAPNLSFENQDTRMASNVAGVFGEGI